MKKIKILAMVSCFTLSGASLGNAQMTNAHLGETILEKPESSLLAQGSPWGQVVSPQTYTNPDTGQVLCFYSSGRWAPCPGQGDTIIIPRNAKCRGSATTTDLMNQCPAAICLLDNAQSRLVQPGEYRSPHPPCIGLP